MKIQPHFVLLLGAAWLVLEYIRGNDDQYKALPGQYNHNEGNASVVPQGWVQ